MLDEPEVPVVLNITMSGRNTRHIKEDVGCVASPSSQRLQHTPVLTGGSGSGGKDPSGGGEVTSPWARVLQERHSQKENLMSQVKDLREKNRKYKEHLDQWLVSRRQADSQQKTHSLQLADRDQLIQSLQSVVEDQALTIQQLEHRLYATTTTTTTTAASPRVSGTSVDSANTVPPSPTPAAAAAGGVASCRGSVTSRLIADIKTLHEDKAHLLSQLCEAQREVQVCQSELREKAGALRHLQAEIGQDNGAQVGSADSGSCCSCSTDTEKQVEALLRSENERLTAEVYSLHRFYTHNSALSFSPQAEQLRRLEEERGELQRQLLQRELVQQQQELVWKEQEAELKTRLELLQADVQRSQQCSKELQDKVTAAEAAHQQTSQALRKLKVECVALQARDPDVVTKVVKVEVESEQLKAQVLELEQQGQVWEQRCRDRDSTLDHLQQQLQQLNTKVQQGEEENSALKACLLEEVEKERQAKQRAVRDTQRAMEARMCDLQLTCQRVRLDAARLQSSAGMVKQDHGALVDLARQLPALVAGLVKDTQQQVTQAIHQVSEENKSLVRKYHKEMRLRKKYHNELVELKGNIRVMCRVRPPIKEDGTGAPADIVVTYDPDDDGLVYVTNKGRVQSFDFDRVFSPSSSQTEVFEEVKALVTSCIDGFNVCIFAYGQTGSGKTFTMEGPESDPGINQRALLQLFSETAEKGQDWQFTIEVSVLEIYNETIRDLLNSDSGNKLDVKMKGEGGGFHVPGLVTKAVSSLQQVNQVFAEGRRNRATATTNMNEHSSRSHCLLCVSVSGVNPTTNSRSFGRLNLVDLAGSERVSKSGSDGARLKEAQSINKSLAALGDVIHALRVKQSHIPFRNSKLTYLLQDSLEGDSKTLMIVQAAPVEKNVSETTYTLGFGQRARSVELGAAKRALDTVDSETRSAASPLSATGSPPAKRRHLSPRSTPLIPSQPRFTPTPNKSSPTSRLLRHNSRK